MGGAGGGDDACHGAPNRRNRLRCSARRSSACASTSCASSCSFWYVFISYFHRFHLRLDSLLSRRGEGVDGDGVSPASIESSVQLFLLVCVTHTLGEQLLQLSKRLRKGSYKHSLLPALWLKLIPRQLHHTPSLPLSDSDATLTVHSEICSQPRTPYFGTDAGLPPPSPLFYTYTHSPPHSTPHTRSSTTYSL